MTNWPSRLPPVGTAQPNARLFQGLLQVHGAACAHHAASVARAPANAMSAGEAEQVHQATVQRSASLFVHIGHYASGLAGFYGFLPIEADA